MSSPVIAARTALKYLFVPGLRNSGLSHWQSFWERRLDGQRVQQDNWNVADLDRWATRVAETLDECTQPVLLIAHSFGCLASVQALTLTATPPAAMLLVAPADPKKIGVASQGLKLPITCPSLLAASENDPWLDITEARRLARIWGSEWVNLGAAGHVNVESGHGSWPEGLSLLRRLSRSALRRSTTASSLRDLNGTLSLRQRRRTSTVTDLENIHSAQFLY